MEHSWTTGSFVLIFSVEGPSPPFICPHWQHGNKPALERALYDRAGVDHVNIPTLDKVVIEFEFCKSEDRPSHCPDSVVWFDWVDGGRVEALTEGHKQGWARKKMTNPKSWSMLCQRNIVK